MASEFQAAIDSLLKILAEQEKKVTETKNTINQLCEYAKQPKMFAETVSAASTSIGSIKGDTFYGKTVITAAREYLDMRKASNLGPAPMRDIFEAMKMGGFQFNSKNESNSMIVLRNAISKASAIFHRLPNGDYGLVKWYDLSKIKRTRSQSTENDGVVDESVVTESDDSRINEESSDE